MKNGTMQLLAEPMAGRDRLDAVVRWLCRAHAALALAIGALAIGSLTGCATPYQPRGVQGGYSERRLGNDTFLVEFKGNGKTAQAVVSNMMLYRCAELTLQNKYDVFVVRKPGTPVTSAPSLQQMSDTEGSPELEDMRVSRVAIPIYVPAHTITSYSALVELQMSRQRDLPSDVRVWDARLVMGALKDVVDGKGQPLATEQLASVATVSGQGRAAGTGPGTSLDDLRQLLPR